MLSFPFDLTAFLYLPRRGSAPDPQWRSWLLHRLWLAGFSLSSTGSPSWEDEQHQPVTILLDQDAEEQLQTLPLAQLLSHLADYPRLRLSLFTLSPHPQSSLPFLLTIDESGLYGYEEQPRPTQERLLARLELRLGSSYLDPYLYESQPGLSPASRLLPAAQQALLAFVHLSRRLAEETGALWLQADAPWDDFYPDPIYYVRLEQQLAAGQLPPLPDWPWLVLLGPDFARAASERALLPELLQQGRWLQRLPSGALLTLAWPPDYSFNAAIASVLLSRAFHWNELHERKYLQLFPWYRRAEQFGEQSNLRHFQKMREEREDLVSFGQPCDLKLIIEGAAADRVTKSLGLSNESEEEEDGYSFASRLSNLRAGDREGVCLELLPFTEDLHTYQDVERCLAVRERLLERYQQRLLAAGYQDVHLVRRDEATEADKGPGDASPPGSH
uniref:Uncharacterized protein n=1 Tax=Thermogemmatispora argillosa TaxID=2045280 RepID=A0A455SYG9_9CHLR|nr:hypothetical protein KTA_15960 [Thermogemmatispora argillosa]